jgi:hypothetical protein
MSNQDKEQVIASLLSEFVQAIAKGDTQCCYNTQILTAYKTMISDGKNSQIATLSPLLYIVPPHLHHIIAKITIDEIIVYLQQKFPKCRFILSEKWVDLNDVNNSREFRREITVKTVKAVKTAKQ